MISRKSKQRKREANNCWGPFRTCTSSLYTSTYSQLEPAFGSSRLVCTLGLSLFVAGLGAGPMVLSPLSEVCPQVPTRLRRCIFSHGAVLRSETNLHLLVHILPNLDVPVRLCAEHPDHADQQIRRRCGRLSLPQCRRWHCWRHVCEACQCHSFALTSSC
jgi:hypothetical protein